jgi:RNA polymerase sigma-70 factor (ECF subfamily)
MSEAFAPLVYRWVLRAGLNPEDAKDVVQDVFRAVIVKIADFHRERPGDSFRGWLFAITRNKLGDFYRRRLRSPRALGGSDALRRLQQVETDDTSADGSPDDGIKALCDRALRLIRSEFKESDWRAFLHVVVNGQPPGDIARDLNISVNSVYLAKSRILRRLRQELGDLDD